MSGRRKGPTPRRRRPPAPRPATGPGTWADELDGLLRFGTCTARGCASERQVWVTVQRRNDGTIVVYPVCLAHVEAVWLWLGCEDDGDGCPPGAHALSANPSVDDVAYGLALHLLEVGGRVGVPRTGDFEHLDVLIVEATPWEVLRHMPEFRDRSRPAPK